MVVQVLERTLHCIPDYVLDAPPAPLTAFEGIPSGLSDAELPPPWDRQVPISATAEKTPTPEHGQGAAATAAVEESVRMAGSQISDGALHVLNDELFEPIAVTA